jgi:hypothetical protein
MFDVYTNVDPDGALEKVQRFIICSNNLSGEKHQIKLEYNTKAFRTVKIRASRDPWQDGNIRKISARPTYTSLLRTTGAFECIVKFQEDPLSLSSSPPDDPENPNPPGIPVPNWLYRFFQIFHQQHTRSHSTDTSEPLQVMTINECANYPQNFDGAYSGYAMWSVSCKVVKRFNPVKPSIVITRGIKGKVFTGYIRVLSKDSATFAFIKNQSYLNTDLIYSPRLDDTLTPQSRTVDTITFTNAQLTTFIEVGDILVCFREGNISRWPDVFCHPLLSPDYLGTIVRPTMIDYPSIVLSKDFCIDREYFYDFAQVDLVSFQEWAMANSSFNLLLPTQIGGRYGLTPVVKTEIKGIYSNYNIAEDSYTESTVPYKDTDIDNLGVRTIDGRANKYTPKQVTVLRNTDFRYSFVIDAPSITREQQAKDFIIYSMNSRRLQTNIVEIETDWEGSGVGINELIYVLREENLYPRDASGIITEVDTVNNTVTVSSFKEGANTLLIFTRSKIFLEFNIVGVTSNIIELDDVTAISPLDYFCLGDEKIIKHRYIVQSKSFNVEANSCKLTCINYPEGLEEIEGLTIYSDYFNSSPPPDILPPLA